MSILHLVRRSAFETQDLAQCLLNITVEDKVILMDDGCYNLHHPLIEQVKALCSVDIIGIHAQARAVSLMAVEKNSTLGIISIDELTELMINFDATCTWQ